MPWRLVLTLAASAQVPGSADDARSLNLKALESSRPTDPASARRHTTPILLNGKTEESDYPIEALRAGLTGRVLVSYLVSTDGRASDCRVERTSGHAVLDETTCRIVNTRYRLEPARDSTGRALEIRARQYISWTLSE